MKDFTILRVLKSFSREEFNKFSKFLYSPVFNKAIYIINYFEKISTYYPEFEKYESDKEKIFTSLYPKKEYNDSTIRKLNSELLKLAEEFIIINALQEKTFLKTKLLLEELDKRKIDNLFRKELESGYSFIEKSEIKNEKYFRELCVLNDSEILFHSMRDRRKGFPKYYSSIENLDKFYIIQKLKKIIILITEDKLFAKVLQDKKEIENFITLIQKNKFFQFPVIQILFNILMINWNGDREYFDSLKNSTAKFKKEISSEELEWVYFTMMNYCVVELNKGFNEFANEELDIYKNMAKDNMLLYNGTLESILYKNIISSAIEADDLDFAEQFKDEYSKYIFTPDKTDIVGFCNANIAYARKNYPKALDILAKINFSDVNQKLSLRNLSLKIFYENEMYEQALLNIDSYKQILKREKTLPEDILKLYKNFIALYSKLLKIKLSKEKSDAKLLLNSIKKTDSVAKNWLIEQCNSLYGYF